MGSLLAKSSSKEVKSGPDELEHKECEIPTRAVWRMEDICDAKVVLFIGASSLVLRWRGNLTKCQDHHDPQTRLRI